MAWEIDNIDDHEAEPPTDFFADGDLDDFGDADGGSAENQPQQAAQNPANDCFVASAVFNDPYHPCVVQLRKYRDEQLRFTLSGRLFIKIYAVIGPVLARLCCARLLPTRLIRKVLERFVKSWIGD